MGDYLIMLDVRKDIKPVKSGWSILHEGHILLPLEGKNKGHETNTETNTHIVNSEILCMKIYRNL